MVVLLGPSIFSTYNQEPTLARRLAAMVTPNMPYWTARLVNRSQNYGRYLQIPIVLTIALLLWEGLVRWQAYPAFILPSPFIVARKFGITLANGTLLRHTQVTLLEIALGLLGGLLAAFILGYILGKNRTIERIAAPYIVASQSIPIVAIAPLLVIWFGSGLTSKVLVCGLITFFPTLISTIVGIRNVDADLCDLMRSLRASRWQVVVGAVVGEFVGADVGLGFLINLARGVLDTPLMFVAVISLIAIAQILYLLVSLLEHYYLRWQR